jgi:hypothetical protein
MREGRSRRVRRDAYIGKEERKEGRAYTYGK